MLKVIVGGIIEPIIYHKRADKLLVELPGCNRNINDCIFINRVNIFQAAIFLRLPSWLSWVLLLLKLLWPPPLLPFTIPWPLPPLLSHPHPSRPLELACLIQVQSGQIQLPPHL